MNSLGAACLVLVVICVVMLGIFALVSALFGSTAGWIVLVIGGLLVGLFIAAAKQQG